MDPLDRLRSAGKRMTDPAESLAQRVAERVVDLLVRALDVNAVIQRVDPNAVLDQVDTDEFLRRVGVNALLDRVDVNALLDRVDVAALLERADINDILQRVDVGALLDRVDVNDLVSRIDMDALVKQTDLGAVIATSSGGVASEALDAARSQAVGLDQFIDRWLGRLLRRKHPRPPAPPAGLEAGAPVTARTRQAAGWVTSQGHYAGSVSRFLAFVIDAAASAGLFALGLAATSFAAQVVTGHSVTWSRSHIGVAIIFAAWQFCYFGYSWAASGKTFGMAVLGVRVVRADGAIADAWRGAVRAVVFPLSFLFFGLGFAGILVQRERRALHDLIAGTAVVYAWDARAARLRFLAREAGSGAAGVVPGLSRPSAAGDAAAASGGNR